jgi:ATP-dependent phosphofructokinase / diphosphate-dependent phosphofructokinase
MPTRNEILTGNMIVAQGGGPTPVINCSLSGVLEEARRKKSIGKIFGAIHGVEGVLGESLVNLSILKDSHLRLLRKTPGAFLGSCRKKLTEEDYQRIISVFRKHEIRYFFYIGGNDSMDSADKINKLSAREGYELRVIGIPKTIDNDLPYTDHCPGYGSAARYVASVTREISLDIESLPPPITVIETMGRNTGWIAAASALAKQTQEDGPHLIYFPEKPVSEEKVLAEIQAVYGKYKRAVVVVSEGLKNEEGEYWGAVRSSATVDNFGHKLPGGAASFLASLISDKLKVRARNEKPGLCGRTSIYYASKVDQQEAYAVGKEAVKSAVEGKSGLMVTIQRKRSKLYEFALGEVELSKVANAEKFVPDDFINEESNFVTEKFRKYCRPLVGEDLPEYMKLRDFLKTKDTPR